MQGRNAQVARIYRILNLLEGSPQGLSALEIKEKLEDRGFDVSKRTVYRDLEALSEAGFPLFPQEPQEDENVTRWVLERSTRINQYLALSTKELFALHLARGILASAKGSWIHADLEQVFQKIEEKLGSSHRGHIEELSSEVRFDQSAGSNVDIDPDVLETVRAACAEEQVLSVEYRSLRSGTERRRKLGPHFVYFSKGSIYLVAEDLDQPEPKLVKLFALPRMKNAVMEDIPYVAAPIDPQKLFESSFGVFRGERPEEVEIEFSARIASYIAERRWHSSQRLEKQARGNIVLKMNVAITPELVQWVLGFGADAQVLKPGDLRDRLTESVAAMAELYAQPSRPHLAPSSQ
jgi:proteasome accessory factor B